MKLNIAVNEVVLSNVTSTGEFKIRNSAKAFSILSSGLYSNKIKAIIRELSTNALDSHVGANKHDTPFEVHLPTFLEPWFAVKDFGLGLDGDQVVNIYTTYFESTKTDSNDFIGALGLGSKSPFSYTDNFTVTAIKNGYKRIYSAFINDVGVPSIAEMAEELTDEINGVEVKFSVTNRYDFNTFRSESSEVFSWFKHKPNITGVDDFSHRDMAFLEKDIVPGVHTISGRSSTAVMGNIAYSLNSIPEADKHFGELANLLNCGLVIEFNIGDLDFAASREQLSYIPLTINSIRSKLEELNSNLAVHLASRANAIPGEWKKALFLYSEHNKPLYKAAVSKYVADTKFPLYDTTAYNGAKIFTLTVSELALREMSIRAFRRQYNGCNTITTSTAYVNNQHEKVVRISVDENVVIVLNDLKTGCVNRARYHYNKMLSNVTVFCVSHEDPDMAMRQLEYDKLIAELHNPPVIIKASKLMKQERCTPISTNGITVYARKAAKYSGVTDSYTWTPHAAAIDENKTYYYVCLNGHESINPDGTPFNATGLRLLMDKCGVASISGIKIFGVRKNRIKEIAALDNWVWIEDILKEETAKITNKHIESLVATETLDSYYTRFYSNESVVRRVGPQSDYAKYVTSVKKIPRATGDVAQLVELCRMYGNSLHAETVKKQLQDAKNSMYVKYPLLKYFRDSDTPAQETDIAEYIKLIDRTL